MHDLGESMHYPSLTKSQETLPIFFPITSLRDTRVPLVPAHRDSDVEKHGADGRLKTFMGFRGRSSQPQPDQGSIAGLCSL